MSNESLTHKKFSPSIFGKIMISYIIMGIIFILSTLFITMFYSINNVEENIESHIMSTAKSIAANPIVIDVLSDKQVDPVLNDYRVSFCWRR